MRPPLVMLSLGHLNTLVSLLLLCLWKPLSYMFLVPPHEASRLVCKNVLGPHCQAMTMQPRPFSVALFVRKTLLISKTRLNINHNPGLLSHHPHPNMICVLPHIHSYQG